MESLHRIKCVAHRGEEFDAPEGSAPAFSLAMKYQADIVKLDVQATRDGVLVISHDETLKRTMDWDVRIEDLTWEEIRTQGRFLPLGGYENERLLSLKEALEIVKDAPEFWVDFKESSPEIFEDVIALFNEYSIDHSRIMVATGSESALEYALKHYTHIRRIKHIFCSEEEIVRSIAESGRITFETLWKVREQFDLFGMNLPVYAYRNGTLQAQTIRKLQENSVWCSMWFIHTAEEAEAVCKVCPDAFVTGRISRVRPFCSVMKDTP